MINEYGFHRLALINSGKYSLAYIPLDDAVALQGHNNRGKTTIINALQFLLVADKQQMSFDTYSLKDSCKFYFPSSTSYILSEVHLKTGFVVIGCVGTGLGGEYRYFAYDGTLEIDEFMIDDSGQRRIASFHELGEHLAKSDRRVVFFDKPKSFRDQLFGDGDTKGGSVPDFEIFPLAQRGASRETFGRVLTNTLRLDQITGEVLKHRLVDIYTRTRRFNLHKDWEELSDGYEKNLAQYQAARAVEERVPELEEAQRRLLTARGKTLFFLSVHDRLAPTWVDHCTEQEERFEHRVAQIDREKASVGPKQEQIDERCATLLQSIQSLEGETREFERLQSDLSLASRDQLEDTMRSLEARCHSLKRQLETSEGRSVGGLEKEISREQRKRDGLQRRLAAAGADLRSALSEHLPKSGATKLQRALSEDVLSLPRDAFELSPEDLSAWVGLGGDDALNLPGLNLTLSRIPPIPVQESRDEIEESLSASERRLNELNQALEAARNRDAVKADLSKNQAEIEQARKRLAQFDRMEELANLSQQRSAQLAEANEQYQEAKAERDRLRELSNSLHRELADIQSRKKDLREHNEKVERGQRQVDTYRDVCGDLYVLEHAEWNDPHPYGIADLPSIIDAFAGSVNDLNRADRTVDSLLDEFHQKGLTRHGVTSESRDQEVERISEANRQLEEEERAIQAEGRQLVVDFSNKLEELRTELGELHRHISTFNRQINKHPVSNLEHFKVRIEPASNIVESIELLTQVARETDSTQSPLVFRGAPDGNSDKIDRAKSELLEFARKRDGIGIGDLFDLSFDFKESNEPEKRKSSLEGASSRGTTLSMKIILGLTLLRLMLDDRHRIRGICYLDEATKLDSDNQQTLIEVSRQNGFTLILAGPDFINYSAFGYSLGIIEHGGQRQIAREHWKVIEKGTRDAA